MKTLCGDDTLIAFLMSVPGIGFLTAITIRAEIGRFDRFVSGKQLSRFCGLSPRNASSGERQADAGMIKAGRSQLRVVLAGWHALSLRRAWTTCQTHLYDQTHCYEGCHWLCQCFPKEQSPLQSRDR